MKILSPDPKTLANQKRSLTGDFKDVKKNSAVTADFGSKRLPEFDTNLDSSSSDSDLTDEAEPTPKVNDVQK